MNNIWTLIKREYLERVRSRSFIIFTVAMPAIMAAAVLIPAKLGEMNAPAERSIVIVANDAVLADVVGHELGNPKLHGSDAGPSPPTIYVIKVETDTSDAERGRLEEQVTAGQITGFLWLSEDALERHSVVYSTKEAADFMQARDLRTALRTGLARYRLSKRGMKAADIDELLTPVALDTVRIEKGKKATSGSAVFLTAFIMIMLLYSVVLIYGLAVMRSVIEEKSSRILEVLLSTVTAKELLAGKILGVGAVGLTQIAVWVLFAVLFSVPGLVVAKSFLGEVHVPWAAIIAFGIFFLFGYLLYSAMYAAIGAMVNTDQEAQQMQWPALIPLVVAVVLMNVVLQHPNSTAAFWLSMVPFFAPLLMLLRVLVEQPPLWQIALCIAIMGATIYGLLSLASRIYRVGILMYGKRPSWPELRRWLRYAG